jgi:hypothetical protein
MGLAALLRNFFGLQLSSPRVCSKRPRTSEHHRERKRSDPGVVGALRRLDRRGASRLAMTIPSERSSALWFHFVLASTKPKKQGKRNKYFAKRNETFRSAGRKSLNSL